MGRIGFLISLAVFILSAAAYTYISLLRPPLNGTSNTGLLSVVAFFSLGSAFATGLSWVADYNESEHSLLIALGAFILYCFFMGYHAPDILGFSQVQLLGIVMGLVISFVFVYLLPQEL